MATVITTPAHGARAAYNEEDGLLDGEHEVPQTAAWYHPSWTNLILPDGWPLWYNLGLGTAVVSQVAVWLLVLHVWARIFYATKFELFTAHPLLNSAALLFLVQSLLILQPTSTPAQKRYGTLIHSGLNALAFALFWAAFIIIIVNKEGHQGDHFGSPHSILGLIFYVLVFVQVVVGILQYYVPKAFGGPEKAKAIYKYHRISGYFILVVLLMTVCAAAWTTYNVNVIHIKNWALIVTSSLLLLSLLSRTRLSKFGIQGKSVRL